VRGSATWQDHAKYLSDGSARCARLVTLTSTLERVSYEKAAGRSLLWVISGH
jgi:hypothetical protein